MVDSSDVQVTQTLIIFSMKYDKFVRVEFVVLFLIECDGCVSVEFVFTGWT